MTLHNPTIWTTGSKSSVRPVSNPRERSEVFLWITIIYSSSILTSSRFEQTFPHLYQALRAKCFLEHIDHTSRSPSPISNSFLDPGPSRPRHRSSSSASTSLDRVPSEQPNPHLNARRGMSRSASVLSIASNTPAPDHRREFTMRRSASIQRADHPHPHPVVVTSRNAIGKGKARASSSQEPPNPFLVAPPMAQDASSRAKMPNTNGRTSLCEYPITTEHSFCESQLIPVLFL